MKIICKNCYSNRVSYLCDVCGIKLCKKCIIITKKYDEVCKECYKKYGEFVRIEEVDNSNTTTHTGHQVIFNSNLNH